MAFDRFMIGPIDAGLETDLKPFLTPDSSWARLNNAYIFRGRLKKRFGSTFTGTGWTNSDTAHLYSRVCLTAGTTHAVTGTISVTVPGTTFKIGQQFSIENTVFTVKENGNPGTLLRSDGSSETATFDTTTGALVITIAASKNKPCYYYPAEPIMGITQYESGSINNAPTVVFDTQFAYKFISGFWSRAGQAQWHGDDLDFFWSTNWKGPTSDVSTMFVSNFHVVNKNGAVDASDDPIRVYNGSTWLSYQPQFLVTSNGVTSTGGYTISTARIILPFKEHLLFFNTVETNAARTQNIHFPSRCRFTQAGSPFPQGGVLLGTTDPITGNLAGNAPASPATDDLGKFFQIGDEICRVISIVAGAQPMSTMGKSTTHTYDVGTRAYSFTGAPLNTPVYYYPYGDNANSEVNQKYASGAGFIDAPTDEEIVTAGYVRDRLIVYFERSTWELAYTGNQILPFIWQKINTELGSDATLSLVPFDKVQLSVGNVGIHACNGAAVERIDEKNPAAVFDIKLKNNASTRVVGIRDFLTEMVYWSMPKANQTADMKYPNKVLVYNYKNATWSFNDDCITAFGYFEQQTDRTWENIDATWAESTEMWNSSVVQAQSKLVLAGNQQGYLFTINSSCATNAPAMSITNVTALPFGFLQLDVVDHTLTADDYVKIEHSRYALPGGAAVGITDGAGDAGGTITDPFILANIIGTKFIIGAQVYVVNALGNPVVLDNVGGGMATLDTTTGVYAFAGCTATTQIIILPVARIVRIYDIQDDIEAVVPGYLPGVYLGGGTLARVSKIDCLSKQWNPYLDKDYSFQLAKIDFNVDKTSAGQITVDSSPSYTTLSLLDEARYTGTQLGTGVLDTFPYALNTLESSQDQLWHQVYFQTMGDSAQIRLTLTEEQMTSPAIVESGFELNAMILFTRKTSTRI